MNFLADESCDSRIVLRVREAGHDVYSIRESMPGISDTSVLQLALDSERILLTEDKDFGEHVFVNQTVGAGVVLFRIPLAARHWIVNAVAPLLDEHRDRLPGSFTVISPGRVRFSSRLE